MIIQPSSNARPTIAAPKPLVSGTVFTHSMKDRAFCPAVRPQRIPPAHTCQLADSDANPFTANPMTDQPLIPPPYRRQSPWPRAVDIVAAIDKRQASVESILDECLRRITKREQMVRAWAWVDEGHAERAARALPPQTPAQPLYGVPVGIKDIIDTADMPTSYGSALYANHHPDKDAIVVSRLRAAGAIIVGKTVTTEFAYAHPGPTSNPHELTHTPGGSSSGSAAAVADGMVPIALGTQTGGSTIRPSAYCGVVGFKPSFSAVTMQGIRPLAPSMDTIGIHARSVADVALVYPVLAGLHATGPRKDAIENHRRPVRVGFYPGPHVQDAEEDAQHALGLAARRMVASGMDVQPITLPADLFAALSAANRTLMAYEGARIAADDYRRGRDLLGPRTRDLIKTGNDIDIADYERARELTATCQRLFANAMKQFDLVLTFSSPGEAPLKVNGTGSSTFNRAWTTMGAPCLTLPFGFGKSGILPLGIQLVGACGADKALLENGALVEKALENCSD